MASRTAASTSRPAFTMETTDFIILIPPLPSSLF
jgi:hypothetical protein